MSACLENCGMCVLQAKGAVQFLSSLSGLLACQPASQKKYILHKLKHDNKNNIFLIDIRLGGGLQKLSRCEDNDNEVNKKTKLDKNPKY